MRHNFTLYLIWRLMFPKISLRWDYCLLSNSLRNISTDTKQKYDYIRAFEADYKTGAKNNLKSRKMRACVKRNWILASDWSRQVTWPEYWPLIGHTSWCTRWGTPVWSDSRHCPCPGRRTESQPSPRLWAEARGYHWRHNESRLKINKMKWYM